ncbi:MAG: UxaA family hydrolase [Treponema sp.]|jgi:galactarate dehydratase|nr:UxaA family hydrolase [Treponema sp.]
MTRLIKLNENDNVAIPVEDVRRGATLADGFIALCDIPQGHKIALSDLRKGDAVIRYGVRLGFLKQEVKRGSWINEYMLDLPAPPDLDSMPCADNIKKDLPEAPRKTFEGFEIEGEQYAGTRNILGIMTTVQCVTGILNVAVEKMKRELLPKYPNVDDIVALNHAYGCGVAINARESHIPICSLKNLVHNPNFGGEIFMVGLGCEKLTIDKLLEPEENTAENVIILQNYGGFQKIMDVLMKMAGVKLKKLNERKRATLPLEKLCVGMQCGGSDAFSGVTANPAAGYSSDLLVSAGATVLFSELTEVRDGVHFIASRCCDADIIQKLANEMRWYDKYLEEGGADRSANPTPGNKKGGLVNIMEKAMGSITKSGSAPIVDVLSPGERPTKHGLIFAATPASDIVCGPEQLASGITLQVFMTGRGTPYGLAVAPVIKVSSRTDLKNMWDDIIDVNAGTIIEGKESIQEVGIRLFNIIVDTASGKYKPYAERYGLHNDLCIFNPAPIT